MRGLFYAFFALTISFVTAHPLTQHSKGLTKRTVDLNAFRLKVMSEYTNSSSVSTDTPLKITKRATNEDTATELVKAKVPGATFRLVESYTGINSVAHFYFKQTANGIDIDNADFNVNVGI